MATTKKTTKPPKEPQLDFLNLPKEPQNKPETKAEIKPVTEQPPTAAKTAPAAPQQPPQQQNAPQSKPQVPLDEEKKKQPTWIDYLQDRLTKYEQKVLPDLLSKHGISTSQFKQIVIAEVKKNPKLLEALMHNPSSMFASILAGAEIGLIPSAMLGEFFLIPRKLKDVGMTVTPLIGYKGLHTILMRSGEISRLHTEVVFEGERFEPIYGLEPNIIHIPRFDIERTAAKIVNVYAVAKYANGSYQFAIMNRAEVEAVRKLSPYENTMYFNDNEDPMHWMVKKTALFQLGKMLPKDYYGKKALELDGKLQGGATVVIDETGKELFTIVDNQRKQIGNKSPIMSLPDLPAEPKTTPETKK